MEIFFLFPNGSASYQASHIFQYNQNKDLKSSAMSSDRTRQKGLGENLAGSCSSFLGRQTGLVLVVVCRHFALEYFKSSEKHDEKRIASAIEPP